MKHLRTIIEGKIARGFARAAKIGMVTGMLGAWGDHTYRTFRDVYGDYKFNHIREPGAKDRIQDWKRKLEPRLKRGGTKWYDNPQDAKKFMDAMPDSKWAPFARDMAPGSRERVIEPPNPNHRPRRQNI